MTTLAGAGRLSPDHIAQYERDGYTLFQQPVFAPEKFARLRAIFEENLQRFSEFQLDMVHTHDPRLMEFVLAEEVLDLVEPLVGPNIGLWASHLICKPPRTGKATPWHEDSAYWQDRVSSPVGICTVWLAIDEATPENGSMGVIPGSHTNGFSEYVPADNATNIFGAQIKPEMVDEDRAVFFSLKPNECSLHEARIIHGARANTSEKRRAGYTMRYFPTTMKIHRDHPQFGEHKVWLARGRDHAGNRYE